jgi:hypothetical protein
MLEFLSNYFADFNIPDINMETPLFEAIKSENL